MELRWGRGRRKKGQLWELVDLKVEPLRGEEM